MKKTLLSSTAAVVVALGTTLAITQQSGAQQSGAQTGGGAGASGGAAGSGGVTQQGGASGSGAVSPGGERRQGASEQQGSPKGSAQVPSRSDSSTGGAANGKAPASAQDNAAPSGGKAAQGAQDTAPSSGGKAAQGQAGSSQTTGAINTQVTAEQKTQLRQTINTVNLQKSTNVNFNVAIGVAVPTTVTFYDLPPEIIRIVPAYRPFKYIMVGGRLIIIDPRRHVIVDIIEV